jgi:hypothetical protein
LDRNLHKKTESKRFYPRFQDAELTTRESALSELSSYIQPSVNNQSHVHRLVAILNAIDFQDQTAHPPNLGVFDPAQVIFNVTSKSFLKYD